MMMKKLKKTYKGSTLIITIIFIAVLFTMSVGVIELAITSIRQSVSYYNKNTTFYSTEGVFERIMYYIDLVCEKAREETNQYFFTASGALNLKNTEPRDIYNTYMTDMIKIENDYLSGLIDDATYTIRKQNAENTYLNSIKTAFIDRYKNHIKDFFTNLAASSIKITLTTGTGSVDVTNWTELKNYLNTYEFNIADLEIVYTSPNLTIVTGNQDPINGNIEISVRNKKTNTKRTLYSTFEILPFRNELFTEKTIKRGFNGILDYALYAGRNLIVANDVYNFIVNGDINVVSSYNNYGSIKPSENFGGLIAGINQKAIDGLKNAEKNPIDSTVESKLNSLLGSNSSIRGNITVYGNVYLGKAYDKSSSSSDYDNYAIVGGFLKTSGVNSQITVNGNVYCHSIVQEEGADNSTIDISKNAYVADNTSLYAKNGYINIGGSLIGFEDAADDANYNSSPSIVVNEDTARLNIGKNVVLLGVAFIDEIEKNDSSKKLFKIVETSSLLPNFLVYKYFNIGAGISAELNRLGFSASPDVVNIFSPSHYSEYRIRTSPTTFDIVNFFDLRNVSTPDVALNYLLHYVAAHEIDPDIYDMEYNRGKTSTVTGDIYNIAINGGNININESNPLDSSYFQFILNANDKVYLLKNINSTNLNYIKTTLGAKLVDLRSSISNDVSFRNALKSSLLEPSKLTLLDNIMLRGKGVAASLTQKEFSIDDFVDWNALPSSNQIEIFDTSAKKMILISKNDIDIDVSAYNGLSLDQYKVIIISKGNIFIKNGSGSKITLTGNIIAGKDIVIDQSNADIEIKYDKVESAALMNYYDLSKLNVLGYLYNFFIKGVNFDNLVEIPFKISPDKVLKSNIRIIQRRQIVK